MNSDLKKKQKNDFEKYFFKLMSNAVFGKTVKKLRKHRDIKLVASEKRTNYLVSEPNHLTNQKNPTNFFFWKSMSNRDEKNLDTYE